jgi:hypothetical protein
MQVYARTTINEGQPTERAFRVVRHPERGGWDLQGNCGNMGWESRRTFYSLATALREMEAWAKEERTRLLADTVKERRDSSQGLNLGIARLEIPCSR